MPLGRPILLWLLAAGTLLAQRPAFVYVTSAEARVIAGQTLSSKAAAVDAGGATLANQTWAWSSSDDKIASVDSSGVITAKLPGIADVIAITGGVRGTTRVQVLPARIEVLPADRELAPGEQLEYRARVLNSRGEELTGLTLQWTVVGPDGSNNNGVSIARTGLLSAFGVGRFEVRAAVTYATGPGQFVPQYLGSTRVAIRQKDGWRLRRLASSTDTRDGMLLRSTSYPVAIGGDGLIAVSASLDGLANGLVTTRGGAPELWTASGTPGVRPGTVMMAFDAPAANRRGEVAIVATVAGLGSHGTGGNLLLATRDGPRFLTLAGTSDAGVDRIVPHGITPFSLNDQTQCVFDGQYFDPLARVTRRGLFLVDGDAYHQLLVPGDAVLPGLTGVFTFDRDYALDNAGALTFVVAQGNNRYVYRRTPDGQFQRIAGPGDRVGTNTVNQANQVAASTAGHFAYQIRTPNAGQYLVLHRADQPVQRLAIGDLHRLFQISASGEILFYGNAGAGVGLYGWNGTQLRTLALISRLAPNEDVLTDILNAGFGAGNDIIVHAAGSRRDLIVYRATPNPAVLLESGARTVGTAGLAFETLIGGAKQGPPYLRTIYTRSGIIEPGQPHVALVAPGDRLPDGGRYDGSFLQRTPDGDLLLATTTSLHRLNATSSRSLLRFPYSIDGGNLWSVVRASANRAGVTAAHVNTSFPSNRLVLVENGIPRLIAHIGGGDPNFRTSSPAGGVFAGLSQLWVDEDGRVIALMDVNGGPAGIFAYHQGAWRALLIAGGKVDGASVLSVDQVRVAGTRILARYAIAGNFSHAASSEGDVFTRRFGRGDTAPTGNIAGNPGSFDLLSDGQMAIVFNVGGTNGLAIQRPGEDLRLLVLSNTPTEEGDLLLTIESVDARDDGRIYFTGFTAEDRWVAYVAEPIQ